MINEEMTDRELNIGMRISSITYHTLKNAISKLINELNKSKQTNIISSTESNEPTLKKGKQTLEQLKKHNDGLKPIELNDPNLRLLNQSLIKEKVDFAVTKDGKGKFILHFKCKDKANLTRGLKGYIKQLQKLDLSKPSISKALTNAKAVAQALDAKRDKVKNKSHGAR